MIPRSRTVVPIADRDRRRSGGGHRGDVRGLRRRHHHRRRRPHRRAAPHLPRRPHDRADPRRRDRDARSTRRTALDGDDIVDAVFDSDSADAGLQRRARPGDRHDAPAGRRPALNRFDGHARRRRLDAADHGRRRRRRRRAARLGRRTVRAGSRARGSRSPRRATGGADEPTTDSATVSGAVTPNGRATGLRFAYGDDDRVRGGDARRRTSAPATPRSPGPRR